MRIASLLASGTEIVYALGLGDQLVGISHECDYPPEALDRPRLSRPRFDPTKLDSGEIDRAVRQALGTHGSVYELDREALRRAAPDLLLSQAVCEVCAVPTSLVEQAAAALAGEATVVSLDAHSIDEILRSIETVAEAADVGDRGSGVARELRGRITNVTDRVAAYPRPRVLAIEWLDPPFAPGHWVPEMIAAAGGECLVGDVGKPSHQLSWDDLGGLDPDVLIIMPCGFGLAASTQAADQYAGKLESVAGRAIAAARSHVVDGSQFFNRSGPRVADGVEILARLFHPDTFPAIDVSGRAATWHPG